MKPLERYIVKGGKRLRMGYTTGSCAAACARAAALHLLGGERVGMVTVETPAGFPLELEIEEYAAAGAGEALTVTCAVRKDAGDDPDITGGATVRCAVSRLPAGIEIDGGEGVGRVTKPGLACPVGEAAINPAPRRMIAEALSRSAEERGYTGGLRAVVSVDGGAALALRTFNPRLGIEGGISILGTTGIVRPMSESALIATIRAEVDSLRAAGAKTLLMVPGNYGEDFARGRWGLSLDRGVKCSNYIGDTIDYAVYKGFCRLLLLGHAGKLVKLAAGIMNTHSSVADGRAEVLAAHCGLAGLGKEKIRAVMDCVTVDAADRLLVEWGAAEAVWSSVGERVRFQLNHRAGPGAETGFAAFGGRGVLMRTDNVEAIIQALEETS